MISCDLCYCPCSLSALGPNTYAAFQASNDLKDVVQRAMQRGKLDRQLSVKASLMTPVKPMLVCVVSMIALHSRKSMP